MVVKQLAKHLTFVFILYSIPLCPMFFLFKIHSFKEINLLEKCALKKKKPWFSWGSPSCCSWSCLCSCGRDHPDAGRPGPKTDLTASSLRTDALAASQLSILGLHSSKQRISHRGFHCRPPHRAPMVKLWLPWRYPVHTDAAGLGLGRAESWTWEEEQLGCTVSAPGV